MKVLSKDCILQYASDFNGCDVRNMMELFVMLKLHINPPETHNHLVFVAGSCDLITFQCKLSCFIINISSNFAQMEWGQNLQQFILNVMICVPLNLPLHYV